MTEHNEGSPYLYTLHGLMNGKPHEITMDVKAEMARKAESEGLVLTDEELHEQSMQFIADMDRIREAVRGTSVSPRESGIQKLATRVTSLLGRQ